VDAVFDGDVADDMGKHLWLFLCGREGYSSDADQLKDTVEPCGSELAREGNMSVN
jgi:hypothetical protein